MRRGTIHLAGRLALLGSLALLDGLLTAGCDRPGGEPQDVDAGPVYDGSIVTSSCDTANCSRFTLQCTVDTNGARCICMNGYEGVRCTDCSTGLQDRNGDGTCEPACSTATCDPRASCDDSSGTVVCTCQPGYVAQGSTCTADGTLPVSSGRTATPDLY